MSEFDAEKYVVYKENRNTCKLVSNGRQQLEHTTAVPRNRIKKQIVTDGELSGIFCGKYHEERLNKPV